MALIKAKQNGNGHHGAERGAFTTSAVPVPTTGKRDAAISQRRKQARTLAKQQHAAERIASASTELSSSISESIAAQQELSRSMDQIAAGAEEASGAAQESLAAMRQITTNLSQASKEATMSRNKTQALQTLAEQVRQDIAVLVENVGTAADRQNASVEHGRARAPRRAHRRGGRGGHPNR